MQTPDTAPGHYYVSVVDAGRTGLLVGPFVNNHAAALACVDRARTVAESVNDRAVWYAFGTVRLDPDVAVKPAVLNSHFASELEAA